MARIVRGHNIWWGQVGEGCAHGGHAPAEHAHVKHILLGHACGERILGYMDKKIPNSFTKAKRSSVLQIPAYHNLLAVQGPLNL